MSQEIFNPPQHVIERAHIKSLEQYRQMYDRSIADPEGFWGEIADQFHWHKRWSQLREWDFTNDISVKWFIGGQTNICYNCVDRHLDTRGDQPALLWEGNRPGDDAVVTYRDLHQRICKFANALKSVGVKQGDRVCLYMQMLPELPVAMLACARIGAIHSVVFGAFSEDSLRDRINDSACKVLITQDTALRGDKRDIAMKAKADKAVAECPSIEKVIVVQRTGESVEMKSGRDLWWHELVADQSADCPCEWLDSETPLFILYTSGSTGKPKGVLHTQGGYMIHTATTFKYVFDYHDGDIWWCTADIGWITGHSYIVYGPLANGAVSIMFEGVPTYPDAGRFWDVVDKYKVTQFYTAPTAIRALMREGEQFPQKRDLSSLRVLGSVGEPINPEAWRWYHQHVGRGRCPIVDTWWQTETGGILITPLPGAIPQKPGSATLPFFGVKPVMLTPDGQRIEGPGAGVLCLEEPWPSLMRTVYGQHQRFKDTYFSAYPGMYFTGDGCRRDEDGYWWITGRVDDVINVSGHRFGTAEIESALVAHPQVAEAAVVGYPHELKGQGIYAYVTLLAGLEYTDALKKELVQHVRQVIGPIASPDVIHWAPGLPKTRSGKIMRRILRKIAEGHPEQVGDVTTLADPTVVDDLIQRKPA